VRRRTSLIAGLGLAGGAAVWGLASGSHPDADALGGPLACERSRSCALIRRAFDAAPGAVRAAVEAAVRAHHTLLTGEADEVQPTENGLQAVFSSAGLRTDLTATVAEEHGQTVLYLRSQSRVGWSDLGLNRRRVEGIATDTARRLATA
jgi:uncharacterized protein (DUF1499 family)